MSSRTGPAADIQDLRPHTFYQRIHRKNVAENAPAQESPFLQNALTLQLFFKFLNMKTGAPPECTASIQCSFYRVLQDHV